MCAPRADTQVGPYRPDTCPFVTTRSLPRGGADLIPRLDSSRRQIAAAKKRQALEVGRTGEVQARAKHLEIRMTAAWYSSCSARSNCRAVAIAARGPRNMSQRITMPASNLYDSPWWARLATITAENSERPQQRKRRWTRTLRQLIKGRR